MWKRTGLNPHPPDACSPRQGCGSRVRPAQGNTGTDFQFPVLGAIKPQIHPQRISHNNSLCVVPFPTSRLLRGRCCDTFKIPTQTFTVCSFTYFLEFTPFCCVVITTLFFQLSTFFTDATTSRDADCAHHHYPDRSYERDMLPNRTVTSTYVS